MRFSWIFELLQEKRSAFPRFYFIGDDDLLEILGQATSPSVIHTHLKKLFAGNTHTHTHSCSQLSHKPLHIDVGLNSWGWLCVEGISSVEFDQSFQSITAMKSLEGETVLLQNTISISNDVEVRSLPCSLCVQRRSSLVCFSFVSEPILLLPAAQVEWSQPHAH